MHCLMAGNISEKTCIQKSLSSDSCRNEENEAENKNKLTADSTLQIGQVLSGRWRLLSRLGRGAFGDIFMAVPVNGDMRVAVKVEKIASKKARIVLKIEAVVLHRMQRYPFVPRLIDYDVDDEHGVAFMVMTLLGENLLRLRKRRVDGCFTLPTVLRCGMHAVRCVQAIHDEGFLHRDIKPSNFVIGGSELRHSIYLIDFGLARAYRDRHTGELLPSRGKITGFRGTPRYASIHVHEQQDLSRRDDLWSVLYMLIEFCVGELPWSSQHEKEVIGHLKAEYLAPHLLKGASFCFYPFMKHLISLEFHSRPDYDYLYQLLQDKYNQLYLPPVYPFDWEDTYAATTDPSASAVFVSGGRSVVTSASLHDESAQKKHEHIIVSSFPIEPTANQLNVDQNLQQPHFLSPELGVSDHCLSKHDQSHKEDLRKLMFHATPFGTFHARPQPPQSPAPYFSHISRNFRRFLATRHPS